MRPNSKVYSTKAFVLRSIQYQENSLLVDFFTLDYGRISILAKGAKNARSITKASLQCFIPLNITFAGDPNNLRVLRKVEEARPSQSLVPPYLYIGFYVNELLALLYKEEDGSLKLFAALSNIYALLELKKEYEASLRLFELTLLAEIGSGVDFCFDSNGNEILLENYYKYDCERGFVSLEKDANLEPEAVSGYIILKLREQDFSEKITCQFAKFLCRKALAPFLKNHHLVSRDVYKSYLDSLACK